MTKTFEERMKENGYTDKMLEMDDLMEQAAGRGDKVKVVGLDGTVYVGKASHYCKADDEEDGFATVGVATEDKGSWCLGVNEIADIEILSRAKEA